MRYDEKCQMEERIIVGSGVVRGLLCRNCNRAIGLLQDDASVLRRAASYLEALSCV